MVLLKKSNKPKNRWLKKQWFLRFFPIELFDGLKRAQLFTIGTFLTVVVALMPIVIWLLYRPESIQNPVIALAKTNAFLAISTLALNFVLAARFHFLESLFQGLDRMYRVHKVIGRLAFVFIVLHPIFLMIDRFPNVTAIVAYVVPVGSWEVAIGVVAVYVFVVLIAFSVAVEMPYHWWHISHKVMGFVLVLAVVHAVYAGSDLAMFPMLRYWVIVLSVIGVFCWLYMLVFYKRFGPRYTVLLDRVEHLKDVTELYFRKPSGFDFDPGQYVFIRFPRFEGIRELFPFSISDGPSEKFVRLSIKRSGDFTKKKVPLLETGDKAIVMGPYGKFGDRCLQHDHDMLWIAGGIGITPFLSLAKYEANVPTGRKILLIWVVKNVADTFHDQTLHAVMRKNKNFQYIHWLSASQGRISAEKIRELVGGKEGLKDRLIFMCGPPGLTYALSAGLHRFGVSYRHIFFEDFNMLD